MLFHPAAAGAVCAKHDHFSVPVSVATGQPFNAIFWREANNLSLSRSGTGVAPFQFDASTSSLKILARDRRKVKKGLRLTVEGLCFEIVKIIPFGQFEFICELTESQVDSSNDEGSRWR